MERDDTPDLELATIQARETETLAISRLSSDLATERQAKGGLQSPWLYELNPNRPIEKLDKDIETDVAVVGAGIAGLTTAYFLLKETDSSVTICEGGRMASGATGNNGGQAVPFFEASYNAMVNTYGEEKAAEAQRGVLMAQTLLQQVLGEIKPGLDVKPVVGYAGLTTKEQLDQYLIDLQLQRQAGISFRQLLISDKNASEMKIGPEFAELYKVIPQEELAKLLETERTDCLGAITSPVAIINTAKLCEELLIHLQTKYPERFKLYEESPISDVNLDQEKALLHSGPNSVTAKNVILCTNGYNRFQINDAVNPANNTYLEQNVAPVQAYMAGFLTDPNQPATATAYHDSEDFAYATKRSVEYRGQKANMYSIGGPVKDLEDSDLPYDPAKPIPPEVQEQLTEMVRTNYADNQAVSGLEQPPFLWHGLMGYTENLVRLIGPASQNSRLWYNLGCNGIGILPALYGGYKIARTMDGAKFAPSAFDPPVAHMETDGPSIKEIQEAPRSILELAKAEQPVWPTIDKLQARSRYTRKDPDSFATEITEGDKKYQLERIESSKSPDVAKVQKLLVDTFGKGEVDPIKVLKAAIDGKTPWKTETAPYRIYVAKDGTGRVISLMAGGLLDLVDDTTGKPTGETMFMVGYAVTAKDIQRSGLNSELYTSALIGAGMEAQEQGKKLIFAAGEAVDTSEEYWGKVGWRRIYAQDKKEPGRYAEVPYVQPPLDFDEKTGVVAEDAEAVPEHMMIDGFATYDTEQRQKIGSFNPSPAQLVQTLQAFYRWNNYWPKEAFDGNEQAHATHTAEVKRHEDAFVNFIAGHGQLIFLDKASRERAQGKYPQLQIDEHQLMAGQTGDEDF